MAFIACILLSIFKDFHLANRTHCNVPNVFPSISSSISSFYPQSFIWRLFIGLDSFPRYFIAYVYYKKYYKPKEQLVRFGAAYHRLVRFIFVIHVIELTALLALTYISSVEMFVAHAASFIIFISASTVYMILTLLTYYWPREALLSKKETRSRQLKTRTFLFYASMCLGSVYFYQRHNAYCEPYVYSMFSLFEYLVVLANIYYHSIIIVDLDLDNISYRVAFLETNEGGV